MSSDPRGLVVVAEDERAIADLLALYLRREGFGVHVVHSGPDTLDAVRRLRPVALILDVGLPGTDGTEVCRILRSEGDSVPVLFCTARDDEIDRVLGLELGGDDYITKPFSPREVVARVKAVLRRAAAATEPGEPPLQIGEVTVLRSQRRATVGGRIVDLTATEFDLLAYLMARQGRVISREQLLSAVWGYSAAAGTRTVDVHIAQVRAKLGEASPIRTVRGVGYSAELH
jgi:DNA-binding response OmpR family regulator